MEEEKKPEEIPEEMQEEEDKKKLSLMDQANQAAERLEIANRKREELLDRQEEMMARQRLGGTTSAGEGQVKEETPKEYMKKVMAGDFNG